MFDLRFNSALLLLFLTSLTQAQSYICLNQGKPIYTTVKIHSQCTASNIDGVSESVASAPKISSSPISQEVALTPASEPEKTVPTIIDDEISKIWHQSELGEFDDIVILPALPKINGDASELTNYKTKLRNAIRYPVPIPIVAAPTVKPPQLTRRQLLMQELGREQSALSRLQANLILARSKKDSLGINRLLTQIKDRQLNIQALEQEIRR